MIDTSRQLPSPSAAAWSLDLAAHGGPRFVVLATDEQHARNVLATHLIELGHDVTAALVDRIEAEHVAVIW